MVATNIYSSTQFLYTGNNPRQVGVSTGTIQMIRAAVIRGKSFARDGSALPGVTITILHHPEYGRTLTRADGSFDLAVNGGGVLTLQYAKDGYIPIQRTTQVPWQDFKIIDDAILIPYDNAVSVIDFSQSAIQIARGTISIDSDGSRQATLIFPPQTGVKLTLPDGTQQPISTLHVRATEFTIGANGPKAMPAALPPNSAYTYCVEYSADEAVAADAKSIAFTAPIMTYTENFLNFPVGTVVPVGYYDPEKAAWIPSQNGRVVKILSITTGLADIDTNGDGIADNSGVADNERWAVATIYHPGQTLWRTQITHFSKWDSNWGFGPPLDARKADVQDPNQKDCWLCPTKVEAASFVEAQNQALQEDQPLVGTSYFLNYRSDRQTGYVQHYSLDIPLSGGTVPASLKRIDLEIEVAGQSSNQSFGSAINQSTTYTWDGQDAYGRPVQGPQPITVRIGYVYPIFYQAVPAFGYDGNGTRITFSRQASEITLWKDWKGLIGHWDIKSLGFGGWTLSIHHAYDPIAKILYMGDGTTRNAESISKTAQSFKVPIPFSGTSDFYHIAIDSAGDVYDASVGFNAIFKRDVTAFGGWREIVGRNPTFDSTLGDGGPADQAFLSFPNALGFGPDNTMYIVDRNHDRVRHIDANGIINTVAGGGSCGDSTASCGDGGPATQAQLYFPEGIAVAADGTIYISEPLHNRIRRVGPDGIISTFAGNGAFGSTGDGGPASMATLAAPSHLSLGPDGSLYIVERYCCNFYNALIRRIGPDGIIERVGGMGLSRAEGALAKDAVIDDPQGIDFGPDGSLYVPQVGVPGISGPKVSRIYPDGRIRTFAGTESSGYNGENRPVLQTNIEYPQTVRVAPNGDVYVSSPDRVWRLSAPFAGVSSGDILIASEDGSEAYVFDYSGRHLRTVDAITGKIIYQFAYDTAGLLTSVTDMDGNTTSINRDASGLISTIVGPFGQTSNVSLDANYYLASIANPNGDTTKFTYTNTGLMKTQTDPRLNTSTYNYDQRGLLAFDGNAANGSWTLTRTDLNTTDWQVQMKTALGRAFTYLSQLTPSGVQLRVNTDSSGLKVQTSINPNESYTTNYPDGTVAVRILGPDPRFGMQSPLSQSLQIQLPSGLSASIFETRSVQLSDPLNVFSIISATETWGINGNSYKSTYIASTGTFNSVSPMGRLGSGIVDSKSHILQYQYANLLPIFFGYDSSGRLISETSGSGTTQRPWSLSYDSNGHLSSITDPLTRSTNFTYDAAGRTTSEQLPDGRQILFSYDSNGNLTSLTPPQRPAHLFAFTTVDLLQTYTPPAAPGIGSNVAAFSYNADKQVQQITRPDGSIISPQYDAVSGRLRSVNAPGRQITVSYDGVGHVAGLADSGGSNLTFSYDGGLLKDRTWSGLISGNVHKNFDSSFRLQSESVNGSTIAFSYDNDSLLIAAGPMTLSRNATNGLLSGTTLNSITDSYSYSSFGEVQNYQASAGAALFTENIGSRDKLGRITQRTETIGAEIHSFNYTYDSQNDRLTDVYKDGTLVGQYNYDDNGNRLPGNYDAQDRLLSYANWAFAYTPNGELQTKTNTLTSEVTTYLHDSIGSLTDVTLPDGRQITYLLDGANRRIGKKVNGIQTQGFLYRNGLQIVAELDASNIVVNRFIYGTRSNVPDYMIKNGITYRIISDHLGSPRLVVDSSSGAIAQRLDYDEWGNVTQDTNPGFQPFGFAGGLYDRDTQLVHFGVRDYDPQTGRWISKDPILFAGGDTNLYGYVLNDPVNLVDATGLYTNVNPAIGPFDATSQINLETGNAYIDAFLSGLNDIANLNALRENIQDNLGIFLLPFLTGSPSGEASTGEACVIRNRRVGYAFRDEIADLFEKMGYDVQTEVYKRTIFGKRFIDIEVGLNGEVLGGIETKSGNSPYNPSQRAKDAWLGLQGYSVNVVRDH